MNADLRAHLEALAAKTAWTDDDDLDIMGNSGGNYDDAYYGGSNDGEILLARELLAKYGDD